jgi:ribosome-associated protein YbcJ (S4-like RNA binding protein)
MKKVKVSLGITALIVLAVIISSCGIVPGGLEGKWYISSAGAASNEKALLEFGSGGDFKIDGESIPRSKYKVVEGSVIFTISKLDVGSFKYTIVSKIMILSDQKGICKTYPDQLYQ